VSCGHPDAINPRGLDTGEDKQGGDTATRWSPRRIATDAVLALAAVLTVIAIFAIWANRQLLSPDNWAATSTQLLQNQAVRSATANYLVDQIYANVDVSQAIGGQLPPVLQPLAAPAAGALQNAAVKGAELLLERPRVQDAWTAANRTAVQALVAIVDGGGPAVSVNGGAVTLNLRTILDQVASRLGVSADVGAKLPDSAAQVTIMRSDQLGLVQTAGRALRGLALASYIVVPLLYLLALLLARGRRRSTLMAIGACGVGAGLLVLLARALLIRGVTNSLVKDASIRPAAHATVSIATSTLTEVAGGVIAIGAVAMVGAWFAGRARPAVAARRWLAPYIRAYPAAVFAVAAAVLVLVFLWRPIPATGEPVGMLVFAVLAAAGVEALRRQTVREFP
jgi:hypothetical protein